MSLIERTIKKKSHRLEIPPKAMQNSQQHFEVLKILMPKALARKIRSIDTIKNLAERGIK